jgi:transcriptional regulator NrdR family protein
VAKVCPKCGGYTHVLDSRLTSKGRTIRRRQCDACGERYTTYEITTDAYAELARRTVDARKRVKRYLQTIERLITPPNPGG